MYNHIGYFSFIQAATNTAPQISMGICISLLGFVQVFSFLYINNNVLGTGIVEKPCIILCV